MPSAISHPRLLHWQPVYAGHHNGTVLQVPEDLARRIPALPLYPDLGDADAECMCDVRSAALG